MEFLPANLPDHLSTLLTNPTFQNLTSTPLTSHLSTIHSTYVQPYVLDPLSSFLLSASQSYSESNSTFPPTAILLSAFNNNSDTETKMPDLVSILLLAVILLISLKILDYARRVIVFWVSLVLRLVFWGALVGVGFYVYQNGVGKSVQDFGWAWGVVEGFVADYGRRIQEESKGSRGPPDHGQVFG